MARFHSTHGSTPHTEAEVDVTIDAALHRAYPTERLVEFDGSLAIKSHELPKGRNVGTSAAEGGSRRVPARHDAALGATDLRTAPLLASRAIASRRSDPRVLE